MKLAHQEGVQDLTLTFNKIVIMIVRRCRNIRVSSFEISI